MCEKDSGEIVSCCWTRTAMINGHAVEEQKKRREGKEGFLFLSPERKNHKLCTNFCCSRSSPHTIIHQTHENCTKCLRSVNAVLRRGARVRRRWTIENCAIKEQQQNYYYYYFLSAAAVLQQLRLIKFQWRIRRVPHHPNSLGIIWRDAPDYHLPPRDNLQCFESPHRIRPPLVGAHTPPLARHLTPLLL